MKSRTKIRLVITGGDQRPDPTTTPHLPKAMTDREMEELERRIEERKKLRAWKEELEADKISNRRWAASEGCGPGSGSNDYFTAPSYQEP